MHPASPVSMANPAYHANCIPGLKGSTWWRDAKFALYLLFISTQFSLLCQEPLITGSLDVVLGSDFLRHTLMSPHVAPIFFFAPSLSQCGSKRTFPQEAHLNWRILPEVCEVYNTFFFSLLLQCPSPSTGLRIWKRQWGTDVTRSPSWEAVP